MGKNKTESVYLPVSIKVCNVLEDETTEIAIVVQKLVGNNVEAANILLSIQLEVVHSHLDEAVVCGPVTLEGMQH